LPPPCPLLPTLCLSPLERMKLSSFTTHSE
jgi:hypothetical protein